MQDSDSSFSNSHHKIKEDYRLGGTELAVNDPVWNHYWILLPHNSCKPAPWASYVGKHLS